MSQFVQGEKREKTFWVKDSSTQQPIAITSVIGILYEVKSGKEIQRFDDTETNPHPEDLGNGLFKFTFTPEITRKCPVGIEVWFDIWVEDIERIFRGRFGTATKSPLSNG